MTILSIKSIQISLENVIKFWNKYSAFTECHMVGFITQEHWKNLIPHTIQDEINNLNSKNENILDILFSHPKSQKFQHQLNFSSFSATRSFVDSIDTLLAENFYKFTLDCKQLDVELAKLGFVDAVEVEKQRLKITDFMTPKKNHEVEILSSLIARLCRQSQNVHVIDAGDGKGYLSSRIALEYNINVLGIDASGSNTDGAKYRAEKLSRAWKGLSRRAEEVAQGRTPPRRSHKVKHSNQKYIVSSQCKNYHTITEFIKPSTDFNALAKEHFPDLSTESTFHLTGLHTCGNLASACMKIFVANPNLKLLTNVGCCYNLLTEEFRESEFSIDKWDTISNTCQANPGFPMSNFLRCKKFSLGRNSRMLATQSIDRTRHDRDLPNPTLFYRALLQVLIKDDQSLDSSVQVGRIKCSNFIEYIRKCSAKLNLKLENISDGELNEFLDKNEHNRKLLNIFYLIRIQFAPILEAIILLDRILFLMENGTENVFLTKLFDSVISPRCYGIIGVK